MKHQSINGAGLGLRRGLIEAWSTLKSGDPDFIEVTPENWMGIGGVFEKQLRSFTERYPTLCHGLSLSIGGPEPLDRDFITRIGQFLDQHQVAIYSEHLSYCSDGGHLYDLMPIPFTEEAVRYVSNRVSEVQQRLQRRIALENVSYYAMQPGELSELEFILAVVEESDCDLLLDLNNLYVNSINHGYDANEFLSRVPSHRIAYHHVAGHLQESPDLIIDTHGDRVVDPVWELLEQSYALHGIHPTLLERDFNLPPLTELLQEVDQIRQHQQLEMAA